MRPLKLTYLSVLAVMLTTIPAFGNEHFDRGGESFEPQETQGKSLLSRIKRSWAGKA